MKKVLSLVVAFIVVSGSVFAHGNEKDEDDSVELCVVADFKSFVSAIVGDIGEDPRPIPCNCMNPNGLSVSASDVPATCTIGKNKKSDNAKCVAKSHISISCIESYR